jgi:F-type H+-transporting ATPase subunit epsilon
MAMQVELVSPERILFSGEAEIVIARTVGGGEIAFLTGHAPFLGALDVCTVRIKKSDGEWESAAVHGGFVEVRDDRVIILSDLAELASQIDFERARRDLEDLERRVMETDDAAVQARLARVRVRVSLADH